MLETQAAFSNIIACLAELVGWVPLSEEDATSGITEDFLSWVEVIMRVCLRLGNKTKSGSRSRELIRRT